MKWRFIEGKWYQAVLFLIALLTISYGFKRTDFWFLLPLFATAFVIYVVVIFSSSADWKFWFWVGIISRFLLLFHFPNLSDDVYRFIWDGRLWVNGVHPFEALPRYYIESEHHLVGIHSALYAKLNSPEFFTIYPPVAQLIFFVACWLFPNSLWGSAFIMKFFLFTFECGTLFLLPKLLQKYHLSPSKCLLYALNPLAIIEVVGNLHFEGVMIFFFLVGWWCLTQAKFVSAALGFALAIAAKLIPLLFLPLLLRRLRAWHWFLFFGVLVGVVILCFLPLWHPKFLNNFGSSLSLYFQKFEFNASLYYIIRAIGFELRGFNIIQWIGPRLGIVTLLSILLYAFLEKSPNWKQLPNAMLFAVTFYLFFATTVHPWYLLLPLVICMFTRFRFPVLWTGLIFLTYINYLYFPYIENLWVVGMEYVLVSGFILVEIINPKWLAIQYTS